MGLRKLGRYDIVRVLGKGAMGTVYEARDPNLERRVAIKTIAVDTVNHAGGIDYETRFRTEARSAARLQHPNIVSVYDSDRHDDIAYIVMEFVEGDDLKQHLERGVTFTLAQTLGIMRDLLAALGYAHVQNVVHRDVKPANLLMQADGRIKLSDFGVARMQDAMDATRTRGVMVGTLKYMSPEQVKGLQVDRRSDLFSAGIVLYQLLTARQPFGGESEFEIIGQIVGSQPPAPSTINPALPASLDAVVARALAKSCEQRYADADAFSHALAQACAQAQDQAAMPLSVGGRGATGTGSGSRRSGLSPTSASVTESSTMSLEIELVYWKDVRDSDDPLDLQGFLDRFPEGIYADLARRRLRKLGVVFLGEQTKTRVEAHQDDGPVANVPPAAPEAAPYEKTVLLSPHQSRTDNLPARGGSGIQEPDIDSAMPARLHASFEGADATEAGPESEGAEPPRPQRRFKITVAAIAVLVAALMAAVWWSSGSAPEVVRAMPEPESDRSVTSPDNTLATQGTGDTGTTALLPTPTPPVAQTDATMPPPAPSRADAKDNTPLTRAAVAPASGKTPAATPADRPIAAQATGKSQPSAVKSKAVSGATEGTARTVGAGGLDPEAACADRILLGYQICLNTQCAKPAFTSHPVCKQRRAAEQALRAQQNTRN